MIIMWEPHGAQDYVEKSKAKPNVPAGDAFTVVWVIILQGEWKH